MGNKKYIILGCILSVILIGLMSFFKLTTQVVICGIIISLVTFFVFMDNKKFENIIIFSFFIFIPFEKDFVLFDVKDYHSVTQPFFQINILYVIIFYFLIRIVKIGNRIKLDKDLIIVFSFNVLCFISAFWAINPMASFYDALRYLYVTIAYIFFSRCVNFKQYIRPVSYSLLIGLIIQLILGLLQILKNGPIGLSFLGESARVFREISTGYEKGMSGTFGHPGPIAIYSLFILSWTLYLSDIKKSVRSLIIAIASIIIILAAGRTSIALMLAVFIIYLVDKKQLKIKNLVITFFSLAFILLFVGMFQSKLLETVLDRFTQSDTAHQLDSRLYHWELAFNYIGQKPIFGWGLNNYLDITYTQFPISFYEDFFLSNPIHNLYLLYGVELGILGLLIFVLLILKNFFYAYKIRQSKLLKGNYMYMKGFVISITLYCIYNMQGWAGAKTRILILFWIASAIIYNISRPPNQAQKDA